MAEQALYRKYRSADFEHVVGQDHIITSLTGALDAGRISHAYLFTGPRGTGKTSVARLLAHRLNVDAGSAASLDIIEIDAASNRSIDAVRDLRDKISLAPSVGKYKVYIIDEVHMLTSEAFNALLKTLEEPPAHAIFILATTEAHKVPDTIISRTQRFAFRPISRATIISRLEMIASAEQINASPDALELIATSARGGLRDAISLLDQVGASGQAVSVDAVRNVLGYSDEEALSALAEALLMGKTSEVLAQLYRLRASGVQPGQLIAQLIEWWRRLLSESVAGTSEVSLGTITAVLDGLVSAAKSPYPELSLEIALVKLTLGDAMPAVVISQTPVDTITPRHGTDTSPSHISASPLVDTAKKATASPSTPETRATTDAALGDKWPKVLAAVKRENPNVFTVMQMSEAIFTNDRVTLKVRVKFHRDQLVKIQHRQMMERVITKVYGRSLPLIIEIDNSGSRPVTKREQKDDLVSSALEILGGEVVE